MAKAMQTPTSERVISVSGVPVRASERAVYVRAAFGSRRSRRSSRLLAAPGSHGRCRVVNTSSRVDRASVWNS